MALLYVLAGINHFVSTESYVAIIPQWLPAHRLLVYISGIIEVLLACLLVVPATRQLAAWGLIGLLIVVFPANIQMMLDYESAGNPLLWLSILRLPLQFFLIGWAYQYTRK